MRHFLFEDKEYRINPQFKRKRIREQDSAKSLAKLLRRKKTKGSFGGRGKTYRRDARQRCVVKMQYSKSLEAHRVQLEKYLVREGTDIDGSGAKLYGSEIEEYKKNMAEKNYRIFLSPESKKIDLKAMTEKFMLKLESGTGKKLYWQAANHYNTSHPHTHLLINGVDRNGNEVEIPRDIVKTFMREYARDICTSQIGIRTKEEIALEREKELTAWRYTRTDEKIKELCNGGFRVNPDDITGKEKERILIRIENLRKMGFCTYVDRGYKLSAKWEEDLKANGRYNTFLKARKYLRYTPPSLMKIYSGLEGSVTGRVTKIFRTDGDASNNHAVILEGINGKAYFVPLLKQPELYDRGNKSLLKEGELATIAAHENQKGRLTPVIYKAEIKNIQKAIAKNNYQGGLSSEIQNGIEEVKKQFGRS